MRVYFPLRSCFHPLLSLDNVTHEAGTHSGVKPHRKVCVGYRESESEARRESFLGETKAAHAQDTGLAGGQAPASADARGGLLEAVSNRLHHNRQHNQVAR